MSNFGDLCLDGDNFDNSMFVLPRKTELNSSIYLNCTEKLSNKNDLTSGQYLHSRKIGSTCDIPTYNGFSIANGSYKNVQKISSRPSKVNVDGFAMNNNLHTRKVTTMKTIIKRTNSDFIRKTDHSKTNMTLEYENNKKIKSETKHIESFWAEFGQVKPMKTKTDGKPNVENITNQKKPYNKSDIKQFMAKKEQEQIKSRNDKVKLEKENECRIIKNLNELSKHRLTQRSNITSKPKVDSEKWKPLDLINDIDLPNNKNKEIKDNEFNLRISSSSNESDNSLKRRIMAWQPLDSDELAGYMAVSSKTMQQVSDKSRQVGDILQSVYNMGDKIKTSKEKLSRFIEDVNMIHIGDMRESRQSNIILTESETNSIDESSSVSLSSGKSKRFPNGVEVAQDVAPQIIRNRALRKLLNVEPALKDKENSCIDESTYENCVSRLLLENKRRYENSLDANPIAILRGNNKIKKPVAPVRPYREEPHNVSDVDLVKRDPYRFIEVYHKSNHKSTVSKNHSSKIDLKSSIDYTIKSSVSIESVPIGLSVDHEPRSSISVSRVSHSLETKPSLSLVVDREKSESSSITDKEEKKDDSAKSFKLYNRKKSSGFYNTRRVDTTNEARLSPCSLERQMQVALGYYDSVEEGRQQLLQIELLQGVSIAQQETVSLAQLLKSRQWQEARQEGNTDLINRFTTALEKFQAPPVAHSHRKHIPSSTSSTSKRVSSSKTSANETSKTKGKSSTETDASEIEEEIIDTESSSLTSSKKLYIDKPQAVFVDKINIQKKVIGKRSSFEESEIPENIENYEGSTEQEINTEKTDSEDKSIKEVSTVISAHSASTVSENNDLSPKEISTDKSAEFVSSYDRTSKNPSRTTDKSIEEPSTAASYTGKSNEKSSSSDISIKTESLPEVSVRDTKDRSDSLKDISTVRSVLSETTKSQFLNSKKKSESKSHISDVDYSMNTFEQTFTETNKSYQSSHNNSGTLGQSDVEARVAALMYERNKKKSIVKKLRNDLAKNKSIRKEKALIDQIAHLNSQLAFLKKEIEQSDLSLSSLSSIPPPITLKKPHKIKNKENILPNFVSKSSSSSTTSSVNQMVDKSLQSVHSKDLADSNDTMSNSSTLVSEKNVTEPLDGQKQKEKPEEIDTPRSIKQLQFGDINEEYSASDHDSSEIRTPSEKSRFSKEVTENGATKSKSEKFHVLNLNDVETDENLEKNPDELKVPLDETGMMSARTIHSEISEIPEEGIDFSDREIDEIDDYGNNQESENDLDSSFKDLYSDKFSDTSSHKTTKTTTSKTSHNDDNIDKSEDQKLEYKISPESSESHPPTIPLRRKDKHSSTVQKKGMALTSVVEDHNLDYYIHIVDITSWKILNDLLENISEYVKEEERNNKVENNNNDNLGNDKTNCIEVNNEQNIEENKENDVKEIYDPDLENEADFGNDIPKENYLTLIKCEDTLVLPLVHIAVEQMFNARQNRRGSIESAFLECKNNLPIEFTSVNNDLEMAHLIRLAQFSETSDEKPDLHYVDKLFIHGVVFDILHTMYGPEDEPDSTLWMEDVFNIKRNKLLKIWRGQNAPTSIELVKSIVIDEMKTMGILSSEKKHVPKRSRLHDWFLKQHSDFVDRIMVDETIQDESTWNLFEELQENIVFNCCDDVTLGIVMDQIDIIINE